MSIIGITNNYKGVQCPFCLNVVGVTRTVITELDEGFMTLRLDCGGCKKVYLRKYHSCLTVEEE